MFHKYIVIIVGSVFVGVQGAEITFYQMCSLGKPNAKKLIDKYIVPRLCPNTSTTTIDTISEKQYQMIDNKQYQIVGDLQQKIGEKYYFLAPNDDQTQLYRVSETLLSLTSLIEAITDLDDDSHQVIVMPLNLGLKNITDTFQCLSGWQLMKKMSSNKHVGIDPSKDGQELMQAALLSMNFTLSERESLVRNFRYLAVEYNIIDSVFFNYYKTHLENLKISTLDEYKLIYSIYSNMEEGRDKNISMTKFEPCFIYNDQYPERGMIIHKHDLNQQMIDLLDELNKTNVNTPNFVKNVLKTDVSFDIITKLLSEKGKFALLVIESSKKEGVLLEKNECEMLKTLFKSELIRDHELLIEKKELDKSLHDILSKLNTNKNNNQPLWFFSTIAGSFIIALLCYFNWNHIKSYFVA